MDVVRRLEEDQEELSSSLMALTSHYAKVGLVISVISVISRHIRHIMSWQVQLRLQQVVAAPTEAREELLKDLEQFAFRGIPNMRPASTGSLGLVRGPLIVRLSCFEVKHERTLDTLTLHKRNKDGGILCIVTKNRGHDQ